jgi:hypothetical protein
MSISWKTPRAVFAHSRRAQSVSKEPSVRSGGTGALRGVGGGRSHRHPRATFRTSFSIKA